MQVSDKICQYYSTVRGEGQAGIMKIFFTMGVFYAIIFKAGPRVGCALIKGGLSQCRLRLFTSLYLKSSLSSESDSQRAGLLWMPASWLLPFLYRVS